MIPRLEKQEGQSRASEMACSGGSEILSVACRLEVRLYRLTTGLNAEMISARPIRGM